MWASPKAEKALVHILVLKYKNKHLKKKDAGDMCVRAQCAWLAIYVCRAPTHHGPREHMCAEHFFVLSSHIHRIYGLVVG